MNQDFKTSFDVFPVVVVTIITTIGSEPCKEPGKWNTTGNDTEDLSAAAIGRYAPRRYKYGYDQNGKIRPRW